MCTPRIYLALGSQVSSHNNTARDGINQGKLLRVVLLCSEDQCLLGGARLVTDVIDQDMQLTFARGWESAEEASRKN